MGLCHSANIGLLQTLFPEKTIFSCKSFRPFKMKDHENDKSEILRKKGAGAGGKLQKSVIFASNFFQSYEFLTNYFVSFAIFLGVFI